MKDIDLVSSRKRSRKVTLIAMGVGVSAFALTGCEEKLDAFQFATVDGCITSGEFTEAYCKAQFATAQQEHARVAPRYQTLADCEAEHGPQACQRPASMGNKDTVQPGTNSDNQTTQHASTGGGLWMPLMVGWMMGRAMGGPVATQPLYTGSKPGTARTAAGAAVDAKTGPVSVAKSKAARPPAGRLMARGGFGRTGRSTGIRSFGG
ncbi:MAG: DUF1190 domain-containing protein [Alphaproteobacteria bacterium]|jgi:uncharacterized protein YgiB involved in biofilm formation